MQEDKDRMLGLLQAKLGLSGQDHEKAGRAFEDCARLLRQGTETETILQVRNEGRACGALGRALAAWPVEGEGLSRPNASAPSPGSRPPRPPRARFAASRAD
jgi:hypothetical protein